MLENICSTINGLIECFKGIGGAASELAEALSIFANIETATQALSCLVDGLKYGMQLAIEYLKDNSIKLVRALIKEILGIDLDMDALLSGDPARALSALASVFVLSVEGLKSIAYEAAAELNFPRNVIDGFVSEATRYAQDWLAGKALEIPDLPSVGELVGSVVKEIQENLPTILADAIGELLSGLAPGVGGLKFLLRILKVFSDICQQLLAFMKFLISAVCKAGNCSPATVNEIGQGFKDVLIAMLAPLMGALIKGVLGKLLCRLKELLAKLILAVREFVKGVLKKILTLLWKRKGTSGGKGCGCSGPSGCPLPPPAANKPKPKAQGCGNCFVAGTLVKTNADRMLIERILVNERMNPALPNGWEVAAAPIEGRYVDWRQVDLVLLADNAPCGTATLLRPVAWVEKQAARVGETVFLNLPEIGIEGPAQVVSIEETFVVPGTGRLVTGVFRHQAGSILELKIEGEHQPLGTTKSHPFWSVDREDWISAHDLKHNP